MKKQFLLLALVTFSGIILSTLSDNKVNACGKNTTPGLAAKKCKMQKAPIELTSDIDQAPDMFMNPLSRQ